MGFFDLLKEEPKEVEEPQEEIKEAEVVEDQPAEEPKKEVKKETKKETKKTSKPNSKNKTVKKELETGSLEEQIFNVPEGAKLELGKILKYLLSIPGMEEKMRNPKKNLMDMFKFCYDKAIEKVKDGPMILDDEFVYGMAVHYYDEENPE